LTKTLLLYNKPARESSLDHQLELDNYIESKLENAN